MLRVHSFIRCCFPTPIGNCFVALVDYRLLVLNAQLSQFNRSISSVQCAQYRAHKHIFIPFCWFQFVLLCFVHPSFHLDICYDNNQWTFSIILNVSKSISRQVQCESKCLTQTWYDKSATIICKRMANLMGNDH